MGAGSNDLLLINADIFTEDKIIRGYIYIKESKIREIGEDSPKTREWMGQLPKSKIIDCQGDLLLPGFIDAHVHFRDMKQENKETFETGSRAALVGGITTVISMPNTNLPLSTVDNVEKYRDYIASKERKLFVNIGLNFGVLHGFDPSEADLFKNLGCFGLKLYPGASANLLPLKWEDFWRKKDLELGGSTEPLPRIQKFDVLYPNWVRLFDLTKTLGVPLLFHPELSASPDSIRKLYSSFLKTAISDNFPNPDLFAHSKSHDIPGNERALVRMISTFVKSYTPDPKSAPHIHFCHVSSPEAVEIIHSTLIAEGYPASIEITPHHILLDYDIVPSPAAFGKVLCPLRSPATRGTLYDLVKIGKTDTFGTDHAPHTLEEKSKDFPSAPSGFPGIDIALPLLMTEVYKKHLTLKQLVQKFATAPAQIFGLGNKGEIAVGKDADLVLVSKTESRVESSKSHSKAAWSPYEGMELLSKVDKVILRGKLAFDSAKNLVIPLGKMLSSL